MVRANEIRQRELDLKSVESDIKRLSDLVASPDASDEHGILFVLTLFL